MKVAILNSLLWVFVLGDAIPKNEAPPAPLDLVPEIDKVHIRLESIKEKCLVEELPERTVVLVKHSAKAWNMLNDIPSPSQFQLLTTVRDPSGHTIVRQQSKPNDRLFLTAATTGVHLICFQAMHSHYSQNKLGLEIFIGEAGDPHITSPVEAQLSDLSLQISKAVDQATDLQREQTLQRDREQHFRARSDHINNRVVRWAMLQFIILGLAAFYQVHHLRRFFRSKKLV